MDYFPFYFDLRNRHVLIVGGGTIATRKARLLAKAGARLRVVAPHIETELRQLVADTEGEIIETVYDSAHLDEVVLGIAATDDESLNRRISQDCQALRIPVNVVDDPDYCTVITPAIVDRTPIVVAISSGGRAPVLARRVRSQLESLLPAGIGALGQLADRFRDAVKAKFADGEQRRRFWESILTGAASEKALTGQLESAQALIKAQLDSGECDSKGEVYLVGAGPGDPDLLTFKALRLMQKAEVVLYDRLVSQPILEMVRRDADRIYVGKRRSEHAVIQSDINQMLVDLALEGKRVLRLKGGDPFIFGRGGEEIEHLAAHHIAFQVVPGITAASACACYAGIPLTHRDHSQSVRFVTGHLKNGAEELPWHDLVDNRQTLVFYMGLANLKNICERLVQHGKKPDTPSALVEKGSLPDQQVHVSTLSELPAYVAKKDIKAPTLLIIGDVVNCHQTLNWFK